MAVNVLSNRIKITFYFLSPPELFLLICIQMLIQIFKNNANIHKNVLNGGNDKRNKQVFLRAIYFIIIM